MDATLAQWGQNIAAARQAAGLTQLQLADLLDVSDATVCRWERGLAEPRRKYRTALSDVLGVPAGDLFPHPEQIVA